MNNHNLNTSYIKPFFLTNIVKKYTNLENEKKRKIDKELTKYDVDMGTQFKAQNLQHLTQMSQYLPLFTKKIKDPKAIKK